MAPEASAGAAVEARIRAATLQCVGRWGVSKTTLDDIARAAGCSRATIYRTFPGGKDTVMLATFAGETACFFDDLAVAIDATDSLEDLLVVGLSMACREITTDPVIRYLCEHEPESIMPFVSFEGLDPLLDWARGFAVPHLERFVDADTASMLGEWMARLVLSYSFERDGGVLIDLSDVGEARRFVRTYVLPGLIGPHAEIDLTDPTTRAPSTEARTTEANTTEARTTEARTTEARTTEARTTEARTTRRTPHGETSSNVNH